MIDYSLCPDVLIRLGKDTRGRGYVSLWLSSLDKLPKAQDASDGNLKASLKSSRTPLYITSYQYTLGMAAFTCFNVMLAMQHYRIHVGYDNVIIRVALLDTHSAMAEAAKQTQRWAPSPGGAPSASLSDDDPADNYNTDEPEGDYNADGVYSKSPAIENESPYGVRIAAE